MTQVDAVRTRVPDPRPARAGRAVRWLATAVTVALLWPIGLGGMFGGVIVSGHSMEPTLLPGDLAVITRVDEAALGDIVVFRPSVAPGARVVHRVVDVEGDELRLRGDNNDWDDPFDVVQDDVVGRLVLRVPGVGGWLSQLAETRVWAPLLLVGTGWWLLAGRGRRR